MVYIFLNLPDRTSSISLPLARHKINLSRTSLNVKPCPAYTHIYIHAVIIIYMSLIYSTCLQVLWKRVVCKNQVFSFGYAVLLNEMDVPSHKLKWRGLKIGKLREPDGSPWPSCCRLSLILEYACEYFLTGSGLLSASCGFMGIVIIRGWM